MYSKAPLVPAPQVFRTFEDLEVYQKAREFRMINGYIRHLRERKTGSDMALHDEPVASDVLSDDFDAAILATI